MSKTTNYTTPYANGSYSLNGEKKASTKKRGGTVYGDYEMNEYEKALYDYAQKTLAETVPNVNTFSTDTLNNIQAQLDAYQNQGIQSINNLYAPLLNNLKTDIASRFGNLDNSMFLNNLNNIENVRSNAMAQLAENLLLKRNELVNNELANRYNFINLLNNLQNQGNSNALNTLSAALNLANSVKGMTTNASSQNSALNLQTMLGLMSSFL